MTSSHHTGRTKGPGVLCKQVELIYSLGKGCQGHSFSWNPPPPQKSRMCTLIPANLPWEKITQVSATHDCSLNMDGAPSAWNRKGRQDRLEDRQGVRRLCLLTMASWKILSDLHPRHHPCYLDATLIDGHPRDPEGPLLTERSHFTQLSQTGSFPSYSVASCFLETGKETERNLTGSLGTPFGDLKQGS